MAARANVFENNSEMGSLAGMQIFKDTERVYRKLFKIGRNSLRLSENFGFLLLLFSYFFVIKSKHAIPESR